MLVTIGDHVDKRMLIWDTSNGYIVSSTVVPSSPTTLVAWGGHVRDIKRRETKNYQLATASLNKILIWNLDPETGEINKVQVNSGAFIRDYTCLIFSPNGEYLYAGSSSGDISCISVRTFVLQSTFNACTSGVRSICILNNGDNIVVGGGDGTITSFSGSGKEYIDEKRTKIKEGGVTSLSCNKEENRMIAGTTTGDIYIIQSSTLKTALVSQNHVDNVISVAYPLDINDKFATISKDGIVRYWDATDYSIISETKIKSGTTPLCLCFILDIIIIGLSDGGIKSIDSQTGEILWEISQAHRHPITAIAAAKNEKFFVSGDQHGELRVWTVKNRNMVQSFKEHRGAISDIVMFPDDAYMLSSSKDRAIFCWDLRRERRISEHNQRMGGVNSVVLGKDQKTFVSVGSGRQITFWDMRVPDPTSIIEYSTSRAFEPICIALSKDDKYFAVGGTDEQVHFFDMDTGEKLAVGKGHSGVINRLAFSPDCKQLVSVGEDGCVFVWNVFQ